MVSQDVTITNRLGLHARAAAQLVKMASGFKSRIRLTRRDNAIVADAKSILSVLTLAASKGVVLTIDAEGTDENAALSAVVKLFGDGFGEL
jgi:phosphotransferase system HPr (HPr) family protein